MWLHSILFDRTIILQNYFKQFIFLKWCVIYIYIESYWHIVLPGHQLVRYCAGLSLCLVTPFTHSDYHDLHELIITIMTSMGCKNSSMSFDETNVEGREWISNYIPLFTCM